MKPKEIVKYARDFRTTWHTNNPFEIAKRLGIIVLERDVDIQGFKAHTMKIAGYPTVIAINNNYNDFSKKVLCAHELGHALLHENTLNNFAITSQNIDTNVELEANLFALGLLTDESVNLNLIMPIEEMNNYLLKSIMDYNIRK